ncbi:BLOC-1-related complex subunit 8 isoform X3 [Lampetra fluviatilis]
MEEVDMENKAKRVSDKLTDSMYILANEPSVALFRLQEHVRKSLPELVEHKVDMQSLEQQGQGLIYDVDYAIGAVNNIARSTTTFSNVEGLLRKAVAIKQQLNKASSRTLADTACNTGAMLRPTGTF